VDNLLYLYTEPFDIVVDPFAGGGATIDICKKRLRRYWVSDRLPIVERERDIRKWDILDGPPPVIDKRRGKTALVYLDPPYWKQAEGKYSQDPQDLANMELGEFYEVLSTFILACAERMDTDGHIAMLMQPTQWNAPNREVVDHVFDLVGFVSSLKVEQRVSCPYPTQQYNAQQADVAQEEVEHVWSLLG
jgi:DNA modification methylase